MKKKRINIIIIAIICIIFEIMNHIEIVNAQQFGGIGVAILENDEIIAYIVGKTDGTIVKDIDLDDLKVGENFEKTIAIENYGSISEFVRIIISKMWFTADGIRKYDNSDFIELNFIENSDWLIDENASTSSRIVAYYTKKIDSKEKTTNLINSIRIDPDIYRYGYTISEDDNGNITIEYNSYGFEIYIETDAVQAHNAKAAIKSAWGVDAEISENEDTILSIN